MDWLLLIVLVIIWAAFLIPHRGPRQSVEGFGRDMDMLSNLQRPGRWVLMPRRDGRFLGPGGRARARARERRRAVLTVFIESLGLTVLIGAFPPLRAMWWVTGVLLGLLGAYVYLLIRMRSPQPAPAMANGATASGNGTGHARASSVAANGNGNGNGNGHSPAVPKIGPGPSPSDIPIGEDELADAGIRLLAR